MPTSSTRPPSPQCFLATAAAVLVPLLYALGARAQTASTTGSYNLSQWPEALRPEVAEIVAWKVNDTARPQPSAAPDPARLEPQTPPTGATVLFDGKDLTAFEPTRWSLSDGHVEIVPGTGDLVSKESFGSCRLHLQWWTPPGPKLKAGQDRGNSGIFFMGRYEVQVLDTFQNPTYPDGMAGSIYGQHPPRLDALLPPGTWQTYVIEFRRPIFGESGELVRPARMTVDLNGVRVQENALLIGPTNPPGRRFYSAHPDAQPLRLQDHKERVRYRAIWIEPLSD